MIGTGALRQGRAESAAVIAAVAVIAAAVGALIAVAPIVGLGVTLAGVALAALLVRPSGSRASSWRAGIICVAYALGDRGHRVRRVRAGVHGRDGPRAGRPRDRHLAAEEEVRLLDALLVGFIALGAARTIPYIGEYGIDVLRDAVSWGYALFAIAVAGTFRAEWFPILVRAYRMLVPDHARVVPDRGRSTWSPAARDPALAGGARCRSSGSRSDAAVHLAAIGSFVLVGLYASGPASSATRRLGAVVREPRDHGCDLARRHAGGDHRGGRRRSCSSGRPSASSRARPSRSGSSLALYLLNPSVELGYANRPVSFTQLVDNVASVVTADNGAPDSTRAWRLAWWDKIIGYTIDGPYIWTGKGFGINLADDDGFQVDADGSLRSPHNGHLTMLARGGLPCSRCGC